MSYSIAKITTVADCDLLLSWAAKEKADLNYKKLSEERLTNNYSETSIEIDAVKGVGGWVRQYFCVSSKYLKKKKNVTS